MFDSLLNPPAPLPVAAQNSPSASETSEAALLVFANLLLPGLHEASADFPPNSPPLPSEALKLSDFHEEFLLRALFYSVNKQFALGDRENPADSSSSSSSSSSSHPHYSRLLHEISDFLSRELGFPVELTKFHDFLAEAPWKNREKQNDEENSSSSSPSSDFVVFEFLKLLLFCSLTGEEKSSIVEKILALPENCEMALMQAVEDIREKITGQQGAGNSGDSASADEGTEEFPAISHRRNSSFLPMLRRTISLDSPSIHSETISPQHGDSSSSPSISSLQSVISHQKQEISHFQQEIHRKTQEIHQMQENFHQQAAAIEEIEQKAQNIEKEIQSRVSQQLDGQIKFHCQPLYGKIQDFEGIIRNMEISYEKMEIRAREAENALELGKSSIEALNEEKLRLRDELQVATQRAADKLSWEMKYQRATQKLEEFQGAAEQIRQLEETIRTQQEEFEEAQRENQAMATLRQQMAAQKEQINKINSELESERAAGQRAGSEVSQARESLRGLAEDLREAKDRIAELEEENLRLKLDSQDQGNRRESLQGVTRKSFSDGAALKVKDLEEKVRQLEEEKKQWQAGGSPVVSSGQPDYHRLAIGWMRRCRDFESRLESAQKDAEMRENVRIEDWAIAQRERQLMSSAFYGLGMEFQEALVHGRAKKAPTAEEKKDSSPSKDSLNHSSSSEA